MEIKRFDNVYTIVLVLLLLSFVYIGYMYNEASSAITVKEEKDIIDTYKSYAPATITTKTEQLLEERNVSPSGPSAPNSRVSERIARLNDVYDVVASDPQDETYGSQDIKDNMRYPERSFSPGIRNDGHDILVKSGVANTRMLGTVQPIQPYAQELVQNGALIDDTDIGADDTHSNPNYASF